MEDGGVATEVDRELCWLIGQRLWWCGVRLVVFDIFDIVVNADIVDALSMLLAYYL